MEKCSRSSGERLGRVRSWMLLVLINKLVRCVAFGLIAYIGQSVNAQGQQEAMPSPPGALSGPGYEPIYSMSLDKGRIEEVKASASARQFLEEGRYEEAERAYRNVLAGLEAHRDDNLDDIALTLANLALLFHVQARYDEAALFYRRSIDVTQKSWDDYGGSVGFREKMVDRKNVLKYSQLANVVYAQNHLEEAVALHAKVLAILQAAGEEKGTTKFERQSAELDLGLGMNNVARFYLARGEYNRAKDLYQKALDIFIRARGTINHSDVALSYNNLALVAQAQGEYQEAESLLLKSYQAFQNARGADHPDTVVVLRNLAALYVGQRRWEEAFQRYNEAAQVVAKRMRHRLHPGNSSPLTIARKEIDWNKSLFDGLVVASMHVSGARPEERSSLSERAYEASQWSGQTTAGTALLQLAARQANRDPKLASTARKRQDDISEAEKLEARLTSSISGALETRNEASEKEMRDRLNTIDAEVSEIDARLSREFPEYFSLASPEPISLKHTQELLQENEALIRFHLTSSEVFVWLITRKSVKWVKISSNGDPSHTTHNGFDTRVITQLVQVLRAGLDRSAAAVRADSKRAAVQLGEASPTTPGFLPFNLAVAHELYTALFGQIEDLIEDKQLLIVPSGPLTSLPFHVLVTAKPDQAVPDTVEGYAAAPWLAKRNAITVLPSVASLSALRRHARADRSPDPYLGFGNPLLLGPSGTDRRAWLVKSCASTKKRIEVAALAGPEQRGVSEFFRGGAVNVAAVRSLAPLPETADELCEVGHQLGAKNKDILLGQAATETAIKRMSAEGRLTQARVVHFATHGLVAGELTGLAEPALVLTPPPDDAGASALQRDDGLLTASEVTELKLNADWVVLSACNTAAGEGNAEALSGLARAFFYAGARTLLVSHWPVNSEAAVKLTTRAFAALEQKPGIGRAEALRRAILSTITEGGAKANPSYWAPFVVVGEGSRL